MTQAKSHARTGNAELTLLALSDATPEQMSSLLKLRNNDAIRRQLFNSHVISPSEHAGWAASTIANRRANIFIALHGGRVAGMAGLTGIDTANGHAEWGFFIDPLLRGRGVATHMLIALANRHFADPQMQKLHAGVLEGNEASLALHAKFGFDEEGVRTRFKRDDGGTFRACVLFGLTRETWEAVRPILETQPRRKRT